MQVAGTRCVSARRCPLQGLLPCLDLAGGHHPAEDATRERQQDGDGLPMHAPGGTTCGNSTFSGAAGGVAGSNNITAHASPEGMCRPRQAPHQLAILDELHRCGMALDRGKIGGGVWGQVAVGGGAATAAESREKGQRVSVSVIGAAD